MKFCITFMKALFIAAKIKLQNSFHAPSNEIKNKWWLMIIWKKKETRPALEFLCLIEFCFLLMVFAEKLAYNEDPISFITKIEITVFIVVYQSIEKYEWLWYTYKLHISMIVAHCLKYNNV